ncbi:MAG: hypothetical protein Q9213_005613 [Squamulea squamosa]
MDGAQQGNYEESIGGRNVESFTVADDLESLQHNEKTWVDFFACMQQEGESTVDYGNRIIALAQQLTDLNPALYNCLVFHRVKAGLRQPIKDMLNTGLYQPNSHAMLDQVASAIERKLLQDQQVSDQALPVNHLTPRLTPTRHETNVQQPYNGDENTADLEPSRSRSTTYRPVNRQHQQQPLEHGSNTQKPPKDRPRGFPSSPLRDESGGAFHIRGLHQTQHSSSTPEVQQPKTGDASGRSHNGSPNDAFENAAPTLGRHEVQHNVDVTKGLKRAASDGGSSRNDANDHPAPKKMTLAQYNKRRQHGQLVCHYCREPGHMKNECPKNQRN